MGKRVRKRKKTITDQMLPKTGIVRDVEELFKTLSHDTFPFQFDESDLNIILDTYIRLLRICDFVEKFK